MAQKTVSKSSGSKKSEEKTSVGKKVKEKIEQKKKEKSSSGFAGFKSTLVVDNDEFTLSVPTRYKKLDSGKVSKRRNLQYFDKKTNSKTFRRGEFNTYIKSSEQKVVKVNEHTFKKVKKGEKLKIDNNRTIRKQKINGEWKEISKYDSGKIRIKDEIKRSRFLDFHISKEYEMWAQENAPSLGGYAKYLHENNLIAVTDHFVIRKGYKKYWALIIPVIQDGQYTFLVALTQTYLAFQNFQEFGKEEKEEEQKEKPEPKSGIQMEL